MSTTRNCIAGGSCWLCLIFLLIFCPTSRHCYELKFAPMVCKPWFLFLFPLYNSFVFYSGGWHPWQDGDASAADPGHLHCGEKFSNKKRCLTTMAIGKSLWSQLNYLFLEKTYKTTAVRCSQGGRPDVCRAKTVQKNAFHTFCLSVTVKVSNTVQNQWIRNMSIFEEFH